MALSDTNANLRRSNSTAALTGMMNAASVQLADSPGAKKAFENLQKTSMKILEDSEKSRKEVATELKMQRKSIEKSEGVDSAQAESIKKMIKELEKANKLNAQSMSSKAGEAIGDKAFKGLGTMLTATLASSPLMAMGAGKLGDMIGDKREKKKAAEAEQRAQQIELNQERALHENEMEAVVQAMNNEEVVHRENVKNALEFARNEKERSEIILNAKRQVVKDAIAKKKQDEAIAEREKHTSDLFEKMGLTRTSSSSPTPRGGTTTGVGSGDNGFSTSNRDNSSTSNNNEGISDDIFDVGLGGNDPYLSQLVLLFKELIHVTENPTLNSLELEEQRERRRERKRAQNRDRQRLSMASSGGLGIAAAAGGGGGGMFSGMAGDILGGVIGGSGMKGLSKLFKKIMPIAIGAAIAVPGLKALFGKTNAPVVPDGPVSSTDADARAAREQAELETRNRTNAAERARRLQSHARADTAISTNETNARLLRDANTGNNVDTQNASRQRAFDSVDQGKIKADIAAQKLEVDIENQRKISRNASSRELRARRKHAETLKNLAEVENERLNRTNKNNLTDTDAKLKLENKLRVQADIESKRAKDALKVKVAEAEALKNMRTNRVQSEEKFRRLSSNQQATTDIKINAADKIKNKVELKRIKAKALALEVKQGNAIMTSMTSADPARMVTPSPVAKFNIANQNGSPGGMSSPTMSSSAFNVDGVRSAPGVPSSSPFSPNAKINAVQDAPSPPKPGSALGDNKKLFPDGSMKKLPGFAQTAAGKLLTKTIPLLGLGAGAWFAGEKLIKGDWFGAAGEIVSIPLPSISGTGVDMTTMVQEVYNDMFGDPTSDINSERFPAGYDLKDNPKLFKQRSTVITKAIQEKIKEGHENAQKANQTRIQERKQAKVKAAAAQQKIGIDKGFMKTADQPARIDIGDGRMMSREEIDSATDEELFPKYSAEIAERSFFSLKGDKRRTMRDQLRSRSGSKRTEKTQFLETQGLIDKNGRATNPFELNRGPSAGISGNMTDQNVKTQAAAEISSNQIAKAKQQVALAMGNVTMAPTNITTDNSRVSNNYGSGSDNIRNNDTSVILAKFGLNSTIGFS